MPLILQRCPPTARLHDHVALSLARAQVLGSFATSCCLNLGSWLSRLSFWLSLFWPPWKGLVSETWHQGSLLCGGESSGREPARLTGPPTGLYYQSQGLKWGKECAQGDGVVITVIWRSPQLGFLCFLPRTVHFLGGCGVLLTKGSLSDIFTTWSRTWVVIRGVMCYTVSAVLHPGSPWLTLPPPGSCALPLCSGFQLYVIFLPDLSSCSLLCPAQSGASKPAVGFLRQKLSWLPLSRGCGVRAERN